MNQIPALVDIPKDSLYQLDRARNALELKVRQGGVKRDTARHLVDDLLQFDPPIAARYKYLDVIRILQDNCSIDGQGLEALMRGLTILERYGKNLLRSEKPPQWRIVRLSNAIFRLEVDIVKGARDILKLLGYSKTIEDGLSYPDDCIVPDVLIVTSVTADILLLRQELLMLCNKEHRQERDFYSYIPVGEIKAVQEMFEQRAKARQATPETPAPTPMMDITNHMQNHPTGNPPSYEAVLRGVGEQPHNTPDLSVERVSTPVPQVNNVPAPSFESMVVEQTEEVQEDEDICDICGQNQATVRCGKCDQIYCSNCDHIWHNNPKRRNHKREAILVGENARMAPEPTPSNTNIAPNFPEENHLPNGSLGSTYHVRSQQEPSQESGDPGSQGHQPTISGERLRPTLNSRPSNTDHDNEWTRKVNRMATELMDIADTEGQRRKLIECLADLDKMADNYRGGITTLLSKADKKTSLVSHFNERIEKIEDVKVQLKTLCGYEDQQTSLMPVEQASYNEDPQFLNIPSEGGWSFKSVTSQGYVTTNSPIEDQETTVPHRIGQVAEANLIDFTSPEGPGSSKSPPDTQYATAQTYPRSQTPMVRNLSNVSSIGVGHTNLQTTRAKTSSAVEDPDLQSVFSSPSLSTEEPSHSGLKRNLQNGQSEAVQPAKVQRGSPRCVPEAHIPEIANEFENMNIETQRMTVHHVTHSQSHEFEEPETDVKSDNEEDYHSAEEMENRLEEPGLKDALSFLPAIEPGKLQDRMRKEENRFQTTQFLDWIRAGDVSSFRPEQVEAAVTELEREGNSNRYTPNAWLERNWNDHIKSFIEFVKDKGYKISPDNAEDVLLDGDCCFDKGLKLLEQDQKEQIRDLAEKYGLQKAKKALSKSKHDKYHAWAALQKDHITEIFGEFNAKEGENDDDVILLKRAVDIGDTEKKYNAYTGLFDFDKTARAETLNALFGTLPDDMMDILLEDAIEAATGDDVVDVGSALRYLDNECMICTEKFPRSKITCLSTCGDNECKYCISCLEQHLTVCIRDKNIRDIVCPACSKPETTSDEETLQNFFSHIDAILLRMQDKRIHELFQQKVRDFTLMRLPNFRWCSHCSGGFQYDMHEGNMKMVCPFCQQGTCYKCKKPWEQQHNGITCEQFKQWKEQNDPEFQAAGLARHLKENGIDCPDCKFRYALAKGGCMHFKCTQCSHEFCSGCNSPFKNGKKCGKLMSCQFKGLHAHHPRDCLFFLRDYDPDMLRKLLRDNNVKYDIKGPNHRTCQVMEQKETPTGLKDDACGRNLMPKGAGLCKLHYIEYLVNLVNVHGLDPADVFSIDELKPCLMREDIQVPPKMQRESDEAYRRRLLTEVKKLPLKREGRQGDFEMADA